MSAEPTPTEAMLRGILNVERDKRSVRVGFVGEREARLFQSWLAVQATNAAPVPPGEDTPQ